MQEDNQKEIEWLHLIRKIELDKILHFFPKQKNEKILEIGGGDGYQSKLIFENGYQNISSMDIVSKNTQYFPVQKILNTSNLKTDTFELIFTSHVIPHIKNLDEMYFEINRILKTHGLIVHIVPSIWWSIITNFWHYLFLPRTLVNFLSNNKSSSVIYNQNKENDINKKSMFKKILNYLFLHPLGENPSFIHETYFFSDFYWKKHFQKQGYKIEKSISGPLIYSGYGIFRNKGMGVRKKFAMIFPSSYCYILKKEN